MGPRWGVKHDVTRFAGWPSWMQTGLLMALEPQFLVAETNARSQGVSEEILQGPVTSSMTFQDPDIYNFHETDVM